MWHFHREMVCKIMDYTQLKRLNDIKACLRWLGLICTGFLLEADQNSWCKNYKPRKDM